MNAQEYADAVEAKIKELGWKEAHNAEVSGGDGSASQPHQKS